MNFHAVVVFVTNHTTLFKVGFSALCCVNRSRNFGKILRAMKKILVFVVKSLLKLALEVLLTIYMYSKLILEDCIGVTLKITKEVAKFQGRVIA